jgi:hypothetical protein
MLEYLGPIISNHFRKLLILYRITSCYPVENYTAIATTTK